MSRSFRTLLFRDIAAVRFGAVAAAGLIAATSGQAEQEKSDVPLHNHPTRLVSLETGNMQAKGAMELSIGLTQAKQPRGSGTGNQLYFGGGSYAFTDNFTLGFDLQTYQDPVPYPISGAYPDVKMHTGALWGKYGLYSSGKVSVAALASFENIFALESPLFGGRNENILIGALKAPVTFHSSPTLEFTLTPSVSFFPDTVGGMPFYGTIASIGAGVSYKPSDRLSLFGSIDMPVSGNNTISGAGTYTKAPVWVAGARYNITPRGALEAYVTNGVGLTPATSILTHWPDGEAVSAGLRFVYTPGEKRPESYRGVPNPVSTRHVSLQQDGFTLGTADVLEPGTMLASAWYGSDNNAGFMFGFSPDRDGEIQLIVEQPSDNPTAPPALVPTTDWRYMIGPKLRFMDQNNGNAFSLTGRVLMGRNITNGGGAGVFFADLVAGYKANNKLSFTAAAKAAAWGNQEIAGLGLGVNYEIINGLELIAEATPVGIDANDATWAAGVRYNVAGSGYVVDLQATNAIGRYGIWSMIAQDDPRIALTLSKVFDVTGAKFY